VRVYEEAMGPTKVKAQIDWTNIIIQALFLFVPLFGTAFVWGCRERDALRDIESWQVKQLQEVQTIKDSIRENGKKQDSLHDTLKDLVNVMRLYPPHKHLGARIDYPTEMPAPPPASSEGAGSVVLKEKSVGDPQDFRPDKVPTAK